MRHIMKIMLFALFVCMLCLPANGAHAQSDEVTVIADRAVNLRQGPDTAYPITGTVYAGEPYPALGRNSAQTWLVVQTPVMRGWVSLSVVEATGDIAALPLYQYPALDEIEATEATEEVEDAEAETDAEAAQPEAPEEAEQEAVQAEATQEPAPPAPEVAAAGASFTLTDFHYAENGRLARMWVNVTNHTLTPSLSSGNWYPTPNPDGGRQWVTLLKAQFMPGTGIPEPFTGDAPLWRFVVYTNDGQVFSAYAGCEYHDKIIGRGFEPTAEGGFFWEQVLEGGWFSCGGDWGAGNLKPAEDLLPGDSASVPLNIWLVDPRLEGPGGRKIIRMDFIPHAPDGTPFGVVDSQTPVEAD